MIQQQISKNGNGHKKVDIEKDPNNDLKSYEWQARIADLVGFEEVDIKHLEKDDSANATSINETPSEIQEPPLANRTKQTLAANPFAKASFVGATTLITVLVGGVFLTKMMNGTSKQTQTTYVPPKPQNQIAELPQPKPEAEIEILKTKLALAEQANAVKAAQLQLRTVSPQPKLDTKPTTIQQAKPKEITKVVIQRVPTPASTVYIPRTVTVERVVPRTVTVERIVRVPQSVNTQTPKVAPAKVESPLAPTKLPTIPPSQTIVVRRPNPEDIPPVQPTPTPTTVNKTPQTTSTPIANPVSDNSNKVPVGTSAKAVLATALFGEVNKSGNENNNTNDNTFVVTLKQPLKTKDDKIALPVGTELLAQIRRISEGGMVDLTVVSVVVQKDGKPSEVTLPNGAIKIRAPKGQPLIANKYHDKGGAIAGMDAGLFALGGIGKAAEILNRPQTQYVTTASGNIVTDSNPRGNVFTGVLEGGMGTIVPQITVRNQQAISEMMGRGNIWYLRAGTNVEVYVNQAVQFQI